LEPANTTLFYKEYPYPQRKAIGAWLEAKGFKVFPRSYIRAFLRNLYESGTDRTGKLLIVEDGGFFVPMIHREFPDFISFTIGAVEQTTRGLRNAQAWEKESGNKLKIPLLSIANSKLKSEFEPDYIAKAVVQNIERLLPNEVLGGKGVALFGCGTIGRALVNWLKANHAIVTVYDTKDENKLWAQQNGFLLADSPEEAVRNKNFVIGASGNQSVDSAVISNLMHGVFLISASSEQYEININELSQQAREKGDLINDSGELIGTYFILHPDRRINLLANGYPINFWGMNSMPEKASDLIMSLIFLAAAEVASGKYSTGINPDAVNELAEKYKVAGKFLERLRQG
jgi:S-adenosylhomocysteine hydrolase